MERDGGRWPADGRDDGGWDDDRPAADPYDGRLTNEDFVDPPGRQGSGRDPTRPLYDGRPVRDPYERGGYRRASDDVWARARADYLAGVTAETVCARHDLGLSTLRARAAAEGWRRSDQPDPEPVDLPVDLDAEVEAGLPDYADMARHALVRLNRAVLGGRVAEAAGWMRLHARLRALAEAEATPPAPAPEPPRPAKAPDPHAAVMARMRTVQSLVGAFSGLDTRDPTNRRLIDVGLEALEDLGRFPISDDSDDSDGVFPAAESEAGPP